MECSHTAGFKGEGKMERHRIAVIPGDGIGEEVVPEGIRVLDKVGKRFGVIFDRNRGIREYPLSLCLIIVRGK